MYKCIWVWVKGDIPSTFSSSLKRPLVDVEAIPVGEFLIVIQSWYFCIDHFDCFFYIFCNDHLHNVCLVFQFMSTWDCLKGAITLVGQRHHGVSFSSAEGAKWINKIDASLGCRNIFSFIFRKNLCINVVFASWLHHLSLLLLKWMVKVKRGDGKR